METHHACPNCRKPLPADAPLGLCPECLVRAGFNTGVDPANPGRQSGVAAPAVEDLRPLFPQLEILELIGKGGMGAVYKARQPGLDRLVALKILPSSRAASQEFAERFNREARALARLDHPRIVRVYDFGVAGDLHYLVMEFVDGPNMRQVQRNGLAPLEALQIVPQICDALQYAHDNGVVHRDIKPENLLLEKGGGIKITDFGIAKIVGFDADTVSLTGLDVVGTPHYMAPEQIERPTDVDHRADIYSLGVVFYEMLTGELPIGKFSAPSHRVEVDVRLDEVVLRTLEKEPARRYQQASQVKNRLETISSSPHLSALAQPMRRQPIGFIPAAVLYVLQVALLAVGEVGLFRKGFADSEPWIWIGLHAVALMLAYIAWGVLHYSCWRTLPERYRATSPARAVGFIFIPLFNLYWAFVSFVTLADGFSALGAERPDLPMRDMRNLAVAKAIGFLGFWTFAWVPGIASLICIPDAIVFVFFYRGIVANANRLIEAERP